jgi:hypothetical protein
MLEQVSKIEKDFLMGKIDSDQALLRLESLWLLTRVNHNILIGKEIYFYSSI